MDFEIDTLRPSEGTDLSEFNLTGRDQLLLVVASIAALVLACGFPTKNDDEASDAPSSQISK